MIEKFICETDDNYTKLPKERKQKYREIWKKAVCCPEKYVISVDISSPDSKDNCAVIRFNYEEFLKGSKVVESIEYF